MKRFIFIIGLFLLSCGGGGDDGGTAGGSGTIDSASLNCANIAGKYGGSLIIPGLNPSPHTTTVNGDCTFVSKSQNFGTTTGSLNRKEGNSYFGNGNNPDGCGGAVTVKVVDLGNGKVNVHPTCASGNEKLTVIGIDTKTPEVKQVDQVVVGYEVTTEVISGPQ